MRLGEAEPARRALASVASAVDAGGALLVVAPLWIWWAAVDGGYPSAMWLTGLLYIAGAALLLRRYVPRRPVLPAARLAIWALVGLAAWTAVSGAWAPDAGGAWLAAERLTLYVAAFALPVLWPPRQGSLFVGLTAFIAAACLAAIVGIGEAVIDAGSLVDGRLSDPTGYPNATAALCLAGAFPAMMLASSGSQTATRRAGFLAAAGFLAGTSVLCQSRGSVVASVAAAVALVVLAPHPARVLVPLGFAGAGVAACLPALLRVHAAALDGGGGSAITAAALTLMTLVIALYAVGLIYARRDRGAGEAADRAPAGSSRRWVLAGLAAVAVGLMLLLTGGHPIRWVDARVHEASHPHYARVEASPDRFTAGADSDRLDYYRVALSVAGAHPVAGTGAGSFAGDYLAERRSSNGPLYAHSIWLGTLGELGAVGFCLLALAVVAGGVAFRRARRGRPAELTLVLGAAALPAVYLLAHASFDWVSYFPVLAVPALALSGAAAGSCPRGAGRVADRRRLGPVMPAGLALAAVLALPLLASNLFVDRAYSIAGQNPAAALSDARLAATLDPLGSRPALAEGQAALAARDLAAAESGFAEAAARDSAAWYPRFELGLIRAHLGDRAAALDWLRRAHALDPREEIVTRQIEAVRSGSALAPAVGARRVIAQAG